MLRDAPLLFRKKDRRVLLPRHCKQDSFRALLDPNWSPNMSAWAHPQRAVNEFVFGWIDSTAFRAFRWVFIPIPWAFRRIRL
jgi:hypothetical protein